MPSDTLVQAHTLIQMGKTDEARLLLVDFIKANPKDEAAWLLLTETLADDTQRITALEQCLKINPESALAEIGLKRLRSQQAGAASDQPPAMEEPLILDLDDSSLAPDLSTNSTSLLPISPEPLLPVTPAPALPLSPRPSRSSSSTKLKKKRQSCTIWLLLGLFGFLVLILVSFVGYYLWIQSLEKPQVPIAATLSSDTTITKTSQSVITQVPTEVPLSSPSPELPSSSTPQLTASPSPSLPSSPTPQPPTITPTPTPAGPPKFSLVDSFTISPGWLNSITFNPDGTTWAAGGQGGFAALFPTTGQDPLAQFTHKDSVLALAFSPDGKTLATSSHDSHVYLWDLASGKSSELAGHKGSVWGLAFSPNGKLLASGGEDGRVNLWDLTNLEITHTLNAPNEKVWSVVFSPDGKTLLAAGQYVRLWDITTSSLIQMLDTDGAVSSAVFSPNGKLIATGGQALEVWDTASRKRLFLLEGHTDWIWSISFSPDGKLLASGSKDKTVRLWDVAGGKAWQKLEGHTDSVNCLAFSPDGHLLVSASSDKTVRLWQTVGVTP